jgi:hypothetical protein
LSKAFRVAFSSSTGCTDATEFSTYLRDMTPHWRPAGANEKAYTFFVHLTATQAGAHGQLGVLEPSGNLMLREVETADCHTLLRALAFIGAVMADPFTPPPENRAPAPPETLRPRRATSREQAQTVRPWRFSLGPTFGVDEAVAPEASPSAALHAELAHVTGVLFDPSARASFRVARSTSNYAAGSASFTLSSARLLLCPLRVQPVSWLDLRPCALIDAGTLSAQGFNTVRNKSSSIFWSAGGAEALADVLHVGRLTVGLEAGVVFPFRRDRFYFDTNPNVAVHTLPAVAGTFGFSLSVRAF